MVILCNDPINFSIVPHFFIMFNLISYIPNYQLSSVYIFKQLMPENLISTDKICFYISKEKLSFKKLLLG